MATAPPTPFEKVVNSQFARLLVIGLMVLILQIPTLMLFGVISERQAIRQSAIEDVTSKWGKEQTIVGPRLIVPYIKRSGTTEKPKSEQKFATFLPDDLQIIGKMDTETRYRGLFQVPVYTGKLELKGKFEALDFTPWGIKPEDVLWNRSELVVQIADTRAISTQVKLNWNKLTIPFNPGLGTYETGNSAIPMPTDPSLANPEQRGVRSASVSSTAGIHARLVKNIEEKKDYPFSIPIEFHGSERIGFVPMGKLTQVSLTSNWPNPSFQGGWLPESSKISDTGFEAKWQIPFLGRNFPQQWNSENPIADSVIYQSRFGVDLFAPVDNYHMAERSIKYNFLFIVLTFAVLWLFEVMVRLRVHPLQYLMIGVAMCLFYLLQLALSEHMGFHRAYVIASLSVVVLITSYTMSILRAKRRGGIVGVMQVALYSYLYVVLASQNYSLLLGSVGLFIFLAIVMFLTRRVDWFGGAGSGQV